MISRALRSFSDSHFSLDLLEHRPLVHPQQVGGPGHDADGGDGREHGRELEDAHQDEELAHEAVQARQPQTPQHEQAEEGSRHGHGPGQSPVVLDETGVRTVVEEAHHHEQGTGEHPVVDHLQHGALDALLVEREQTGGDEAHVAHRGVGHQPLHVRLHQGHHGPVHDRYHRQDHDRHHGLHRHLREEADAEADHAVDPHLEEHAGQEDRTGRGGLGVGVGEPGVHREHGHLDGESQEEGRERPGGHRAREAHLLQSQDVEGERTAVLRVPPHHGQDGDQHEHRAHEGEQEELDGRVDPARSAPQSDYEVHGDELDLPEHVEQEEVHGDEHAQHARLEHEQTDEEGQTAVLDGVPRTQDGERGQKCRKKDQATGRSRRCPGGRRCPGSRSRRRSPGTGSRPRRYRTGTPGRWPGPG